MIRRLLIACETCGEVFSFIVTHSNRSDCEKHLDWAMEHVTQCPQCRPDYTWIKEMNRRSRIGNTWRDAGQ